MPDDNSEPRDKFSLRVTRPNDVAKDDSMAKHQAVSAEPDDLATSRLISAASMDGTSSQGTATERKDALAMFDLYKVPRPSGWLSEEHSRPDNSTKTIQICHSCGVSLVSQAPCSDCGHDFCFKCTTKMIERGSQIWLARGSDTTDDEKKTPSHDAAWVKGRMNKEGDDDDDDDDDEEEGEADTRQRDTVEVIGSPSSSSDGANDDVANVTAPPRTPARRSVAPPVASGSVRDNPFFKADQSAKASASAAQTTPTYARAKKPRRLSDCLPRRLEDSPKPARDHGRVSGLGERLEAGERHPICCAAHQFRATDDRAVQDKQDQMLQRKIDRLYKRAEELHASRHTMRHLERAVRGTDNARASHELSATSVTSILSSRGSLEDTSSRHGRLDHLADDGKGRVVTLSESTSLAHKLHGGDSSSVRSRFENPDDVFGPQGHFSADQADAEGQGDDNLEAQSHGDGSRLVQIEPRHSKTSVDSRVNGRSQHDALSSIPLLPPPPHLEEELETARLDEDREETRGYGERGLSRRRSLSVSEGSIQDATGAARASGSTSSATSVHELPSMTGFNQHRRGTHLCLPSQGEDAKPDPWPRLRRVSKLEPEGQSQTPEPVPWSRASLRRVSSNLDSSILTEETAARSEWRQRHWKKDGGDDGQLPPSTSASQWRQNLNKVPDKHQDGSGKRRTTCTFCDPNQLSSPPGEETVGVECSHAGTRQRLGHDRIADATTSSPSSRLRVRQVEQSLAQRREEEEFTAKGKTQCDALNAADESEPRSRGVDEDEHGRKAHSCWWRERYMELSAEVDEWKRELKSCDAGQEGMTSSRRDIGVGEGLAQQAASDDLGIEGLTIVVHMRYRDDLVINTDLRGNQARSRRT